jgi:carbon monoxide dehydrogenase subunit G
MELTNEFEVAVPVDQAWAVLTDLERIAPCMPGAQLTEVEGEEYRGTVKVKVGPITAQYKGVARFAEKDDGAHRAVIDAQGRDTRGQGNANATITASLAPTDEGTRVSITTDLKLTGKVAQFGRGAIQDVSGALLGQFVSCLENDLLAPGAADPAPSPAALEAQPLADAAAPVEPVVVTEAAPAVPEGVRRIDSPEAEAVDLLAVAGGTIAKYVVGGLVLVAVVVLLLVLLLS